VHVDKLQYIIRKPFDNHDNAVVLLFAEVNANVEVSLRLVVEVVGLKLGVNA